MNRATPWLVIFNLALFGGLAWRADHIRQVQQVDSLKFQVAHADEIKDGAVMDAMATASEPVMLQPPLVLGTR